MELNDLATDVVKTLPVPALKELAELMCEWDDLLIESGLPKVTIVDDDQGKTWHVVGDFGFDTKEEAEQYALDSIMPEVRRQLLEMIKADAKQTGEKN